jgi:hypothetical protein
MDGRGSFPARTRNLPELRSVHAGSGTHLVSYPVGTRALSPGAKRPEEGEADHSPPINAEVKNRGQYGQHYMQLYSCQKVTG